MEPLQQSCCGKKENPKKESIQKKPRKGIPKKENKKYTKQIQKQVETENGIRKLYPEKEPKRVFQKRNTKKSLTTESKHHSIRTLHTYSPYVLSVRTLHTYSPYVLFVRTLRKYSPYVLQVRTIRTYSPYVLLVRTLRTYSKYVLLYVLQARTLST